METGVKRPGGMALQLRAIG